MMQASFGPVGNNMHYPSNFHLISLMCVKAGTRCEDASALQVLSKLDQRGLRRTRPQPPSPASPSDFITWGTITRARPCSNIVHVWPPPYSLSPSRSVTENDWDWALETRRLGERRHISLDLFTGWRIPNDALEYPTCKSIKHENRAWEFLGGWFRRCLFW